MVSDTTVTPESGGRGDGDRDGVRPTSPGLRHRVRYRFDNLLARGTAATLVWLGVVTAFAVLLSSLLLALFGVTLGGSEDGSWLEDYWQSLLRVIDSGTMAGDVGWGRRLLALAVTIFGLLVAGTLIGIIAAGVEDRIDGMRRGRSVVIESGHLVVLGASDRLPALVEQVGLATPPGSTAVVVVLADRDASEMHDAVHRSGADRGRARVVYRSGDPTNRADLGLVRLGNARGVVVLSGEGSDAGDVTAAQVVLAVCAELGDLDGLPVVVEVAEPAMAQRLVRAVGPDLHPIIPTEAVGRIAAFALRQRGLSQVVTELTDYRGCDLHVVERPELVGLRFDQLVVRFANARPLGWMAADGEVRLNPPAADVLGPGDRLVAIAHRLDALDSPLPGTVAPIGGAGSGSDGTVVPLATERILLLGWNRLGRALLEGWATSAAPTSTVEVAIDPALMDPTEVDLADIPVDVTITTSADLAPLLAGRTPTTIVLLASAHLDEQEADARTLLDLMELRRLVAQRAGGREAPPRLVVELRDDEHVPLVELPGSDDLLVSGTLGSQLIVQLVDQPARRDVLLTLYSHGAPTIRLLPAEQLGLAGDRPVADLVTKCYAVGLLAIGWRRSAARGGQLVLDPDTRTRVDLAPDDEVVVVG